METSLSTHLFRTLSCKPKGLRVRLKVVTVSRKIVTFEEKEFPAATILSHGLFLAQPTPVGVKDPVLFAVLNQVALNDERAQTRLVVYSRVEQRSDADGSCDIEGGSMMENPLGKRVPQTSTFSKSDPDKRTHLRVALMRNGMVKELPNPIPWEHESIIDNEHFGHEAVRSIFYPLITCNGLDSACINYPKTSDKREQIFTPYLISSAEIFAASMRFIVEQYFLLDSDAPAGAVEAQLPESQVDETDSTHQMFCTDLMTIVFSFTWMLESYFLSLDHWNSLLDSKIATESDTHYAVLDEAHRQLRSLASAYLELLLRPLAKIVEDMPPAVNSSDLEGRDQTKKYLLDYIEIFERIEYSSKTDFGESHRRELLRCFMPVTCATFEMGPWWRSIALKKGFSSCIVNSLSKFRISKQINKTVSEMMARQKLTPPEWLIWLKDSMFNHNFTRIADRFLAEQSIHLTCQQLSTRGTTRANFGPTFDGTHGLDIRVMILCNQTTICFLSVNAEQTKSTGEEMGMNPSQTIDTKTCVKLFRNAAEIASFSLQYNFDPENPDRHEEKIHHFTGRYLINIDCDDSQDAQQLYCFDLAPCLQHRPEPPVVSVQLLSQLADTDFIDYDSISFTDNFLAFLRISITDSKIESADIFIQAYENIKQNTGPLRISVAQSFQKIIDVIGVRTPNSDGSKFEALCWTRKQRMAFYTQWTYYGDAEELNTLLIVCFEVKVHLQSARLVTYSLTHQKEVQTEQFYGDYIPIFHTLHSQIRDYLVMDICLPGEAFFRKPTEPIILGRVLFTVYKSQIQRVAVNGQPAWKFPSAIGPRMKYAGYYSNHVPNFHHRRVFSSDKVVSAMYRLDYKPL